ncbi:thiamine phosphate synthase [Aeromicrobium sp. IC_218]|uniref:thiamine phosphate synthase n=1 Tax=Aeromicrobium sp. IC_218 TaxID=2545468 RepID=UPI00103DF8B8|nr:thiamine phosphate synthase [Aeromicrobium sp. IC_218]TCJ00356.1 thiamine phosphate synthase [Aeromicrobium sp. IC_218]
MTPDVSLYLVTEPRDDLDAVVTAAVDGGVTLVQVRDKHASGDQLAADVRRLRERLSGRVPVVVNDDVDAARQADGVHVGTSDTTPAQARAVLGPDAIVGWSLNDLAQLDDEEQLAACSYVAVSPLWPTPTKPDHETPWGLDGLRQVVARVAGRLPVVVIGGIGPTEALDAVAAGADGVAVVSAITRADFPATAARALAEAVVRGRAER